MATEKSPAARELRLRSEHESFDQRFADLAGRARSGDWRDLDGVWDAFVRDFEAHMAFEEQHLFSEYAAEGPAAADLIRILIAHHGTIRRRLEELGVEIQLHEVRAESVDLLIDALRAHKLRENEHFYPWLEARRRAKSVWRRASAGTERLH